jgi:hypothetical protein
MGVIMNTVWIGLGCPIRAEKFAEYFRSVGCEVRFISLLPGNAERAIEIMAGYRITAARLNPHSPGKDLLLATLRFPEALLLGQILAEFMENNDHREYYLASYAHPASLESFFDPSVAVVLQADEPGEIARRWGATATS